MQDKDLDGLLALAAARPARPSPALMDKVLADALALQPHPVAPGWHPAPAVGGGLLARLSALFGGGPVLAGVCSAAVVGVALGYLNPATMGVLTGGLAGTDIETMELFPSGEFLTTEG